MDKHPFEYQRPTAESIEYIGAVRDILKEAHDTILTYVPECAERTLAVRKLEECSMWANKAIVFNQGPEASDATK